jgi:hypothetical protein
MSRISSVSWTEMNERSEKRVAYVTPRHRGLYRTVAQDTRPSNQRRLSDASDLLSRSYLHDLHTTTPLHTFHELHKKLSVQWAGRL